MKSKLRIGEIDWEKEVVSPSLFLCLPNKQTIKKIKHHNNLSYDTKYGTVNEISFTIPLYIDKNHTKQKNDLVDMIKHRYLIKIVLDYKEEFFIINEIERSVNASEEIIQYHCFSLGYELADKTLRGYEAVSKNCSEILSELLKKTLWQVGYVDAEFDTKFRSFEVSTETILESVYNLAEKFNAVIEWDTINRKINFRLPSLVGKDRGFKLKYSTYLDSINEVTNSEKVVTKLNLYGKDGLSIRRLSPTGTNFLENYNYYLYPFEMDAQGNVLKRSNYLTEELCIALKNYEKLVASKKGEFESLLVRKKEQQSILQVKNEELSGLNIALKKILDELDMANSNSGVNGQEHPGIIQRRDAKKVEISSKENEITSIKTIISSIDADIKKLQIALSPETNFTPPLLKELNQFGIEKDYVNDSIQNDEDLLKEGLKAFEAFREPSIDITIDLVNFLMVVESQNDWDKLNLGDIVTIIHDQFGMKIKAKIIEINYNFEDSTIKLNIANAKSLVSNIDEYLEMLYKGSAASNQINMDKFKWDLSLENNGMINDLINNIWNANKRAIEAGHEQLIEINDRGIIIRSPKDPNSYLVIQNGIIAITNDGGNTWKHGITAEGIVGERVYGKIIMGVNLAIEDENGILKFRGSKGHIFDRNGKEVMRLGLITDSPDPDCFGMKLENEKHQVFVSSCDGFKITKKVNNTWNPVMYADLNGNFWVVDFTAQNVTIIDNDGYFKFQGNKAVISDGKKEVMWFGYLPLETPDDFGVIVKNNVNSVYMTRNRGFEITRYGQTKFSADLNGGLYAEDITTKNLRIVDGNLGDRIVLDQYNGITVYGSRGEVIRLNANEGIAIDVHGNPRFWVGTDGRLYAKDITTEGLRIVNGKLGEMIVFDQMTGITINGVSGESIRLNANEGIAIDVRGDLRFWIGKDGLLYAKKLIVTPDDPSKLVNLPDGSFVSDLTVNSLRSLNSKSPQDYVHIADNYMKLLTGVGVQSDVEKFRISLEGTGASSYPLIKMGAGSPNGGVQVGTIIKDSTKFRMNYTDSRSINKFISLNEGNVKSVELYTSEGEIYLSTGTSAFIQMNGSKILLSYGSNSLEINASGIKINGSRVDIN